MKSEPREKNKNLILISVSFAGFYWILESVRDVIVFNKGTLFSRLFTPDLMSLCMRWMIVSIIILYGVVLHSINKKHKAKNLTLEQSDIGMSMIWSGLIFCVAYWLLEAFRDTFIYEKGAYFYMVFTPGSIAVWMRLLAIFFIILFSIYAQDLVNQRRKAERELQNSRDLLENKIQQRTRELIDANRLLKQQITERERIETALELSQKSFHNIVERVTYGLIIVDENHIIQFVNPAAERLLGKSGGDLLHHGFEYPVKTGELFDIEIMHNSKMPGIGELHLVDTHWEGKPAYLASIQDVTDRKSLEAHKEDFINNVSHELRTPMTSIRESISLISEGILGTTNEKMDKVIGICIRNIDRLRRLIDDLLDISKVEANKLKLRREKLDLVSLTEDVVTSFKSQVQSGKVTLDTRFSKDRIMVYVDHDRLIQVFNNLIGNALKFTETGSITVSLEDCENYVECAVSDTGYGIAEQDIPHVFSKFEQFGQQVSNPSIKGTGLGLAITKSIVDLHGGEIHVQSQIGQGSTFSFILPKYTEQEILITKLEEKIEISRRDKFEFTMHLIRINQYQQIVDLSDKEIIQNIFFKLIQIFEHMFDDVFFITVRNDNELIVIVDGNRSNKKELYRSVKRVVKEVALHMQNELEIDFSFGWSIYPGDGVAPEILLKSMENNMISYAQDRFKKHILVVDDQKDITTILKQKLLNIGYTDVTEINSGTGVFKHLHQQIPDLIILDMKMPDMSGYEVIGRLNEHVETKDIPITILSAYEVEPERFKDDFNKKAILTMRKPIEDDVLRKMMYFML